MEQKNREYSLFYEYKHWNISFPDFEKKQKNKSIKQDKIIKPII